MKNIKLTLLLPALAIIGCSEDPLNENELIGEATSTDISHEEEMTEMANPGTPGPVSDVYFAGQKIPVENFEGEFLYQGDIMIPQDMVTSEPVKLVYEEGETPLPGKSVGRTSARWPENTVYYAIDGNLSNQQRVIEAIKHWEANTNISFEKRTSQQNYVYFTTGSGCASYVGMIGGRQNITLSASCSIGNTIHEIGHAIGLWHEQSRVDRDSHIKILYENVKSGMEHNFKTYQEQGFDGDEFTSHLDFGSIMMYGPYSFSKNGLPTIVRANGSTFSVQRNTLSSGDVKGINSMYPSSSIAEPSYINGEYYTVSGLRVYRYKNKWFYYHSRYGFKEVRLTASGFWYYA